VIDFFQKGATMTKRVEGVAQLKGAPIVNARSKMCLRRVGSFMKNDELVTRVILEVADSEESRKNGLMGRPDIPAICGMQFDGLSSGGYFWMKGCLVPIDVVFLDKNGIITKTYSMEVDPKGEKHYGYDDEDVSAIEVAGGFLKKWKIEKGFSVKISDIVKEEDHV